MNGEATDRENGSSDPYAECVCGHGRHTHVRYIGSCGLCDCLTVRTDRENGSDR